MESDFELEPLQHLDLGENALELVVGLDWGENAPEPVIELELDPDENLENIDNGSGNGNDSGEEDEIIPNSDAEEEAEMAKRQERHSHPAVRLQASVQHLGDRGDFGEDVPEPVVEVELDPLESSENSSEAASDMSDEELVIEEEEPNDPFHPHIPLENFDKDMELEEDKAMGWKKLDIDTEEGLPPIPFMGLPGQLHMNTITRQPEDFFEALFDENMWEQIVQNTNEYAAKKRRSLGEDAFLSMHHENYTKHKRTNYWKPVTVAELKIFIAHLIIMGILRKSEMEKYWSKSGVAQTPFFGKWMSRNRFTAILSNLHLVDDDDNPPFGEAGHNPLAKVQPFATMCEENFRYTYRPTKNLSMDESCCPWKGRLRFKVYNPRKPARFHIKLFQMCESASGYIIGFTVYTGKDSCIGTTATMDPDCNTTTRTVMSLAEKCGVLDKGHCIYFDNYYTSPQLLEELLYRDTLGCGTVRLNRKGLPKAVCKAKLKQKEVCFRRTYDFDTDAPGPMLALKWCDKRDVSMLSTMHTAFEKWTGKNDRTIHHNPVYKPTCIVDYIQHMGGVDLSDQLMTYYSFLRRTCKWWRKLFVHLLNMLLLNAYLLNRKFGTMKLSHSGYRERVAQYLIESTVERNAELYLPTNPLVENDRLVGRHFPRKLPYTNDRIIPLRCCVCSVNKRDALKDGRKERRKSSSFKCLQCNLVMCIDPCFKIYHTHKDFKAEIDRLQMSM